MDRVIVVPVWTLWFTMPAFGCATGLLMRRLAHGTRTRALFVALALVAGGIACALAERIPNAVVGVAFDPLWTLMVRGTAAVGGISGALAELVANRFMPRPHTITILLLILGTSCVAGALVLGFHLSDFALIWWLERLPLFTIALFWARRAGLNLPWRQTISENA